jgi:hypothetical protein
MRRTPVNLADGTKQVVTVHPSALLRIEDDNDKRAAYRDFVADLKAAGKASGNKASGNKASGNMASGRAAAPKR